MNQRLRRALPDLLIVAVLLAVPLLFFFPQTLGGRTLLPADNLFQWEPFKALADEYNVGAPHNALLSDLLIENAAWKDFVKEQVAAGQLPLWQPYILAGTPFLAAGQSSALYPFTLLFLILPTWLAFGWFTVSQLWLAGVNMYLFARVLGQRKPAALIAALAYQLSGFMMVSVVFPMIIATAAWLPFILAMAELIIREGRALGSKPATIPWIALGAVGLGMAALAGHVEALYFTLLVLGFYTLWRLIAGIIATRAEPDLRGRIVRRVGALAVMVFLGLALGGAQLIPGYELASRSFREGAAPLDDVLKWAYPKRHIVAFAMPNFYGSPAHHAYFDVFQWRMVPVTQNAAGTPIQHTFWGIKNYVEGGAYLGILPVALAIIAVLHWIVARTMRPPDVGERKILPAKHAGAEAPGRPYRLIFAVLSLLSLSFIFGTRTYALLYYGLPFINQSHSPFRWVWPLTLSVAVLAGFGAELVQDLFQPAGGTLLGVRTSQAHRQIIQWTGRVVLMLGGLIVLGVVVSRLFFGPLEATFDRIWRGLALAPDAFADVRAFYSYEAINALFLAAMLLLTGAALWAAVRDFRIRRLGWRPIWKPLAVLTVILDLALSIYGFHPAADPALLNVTPPALAVLQAQTIQGRSASTPPADWSPYLWRYAIYEELEVGQPAPDTLNSNTGWLYGLREIGGYDSLIPAQYAEYMAAIQPQTDLPYNRIAPLYSAYPGAYDSPLIDLLNVRYLISETPLPDANPVKWRLAYEDEAVLIYENRGAAYPAFTLPQYSAVLYPPGRFASAAADYDPRINVLVETPGIEEIEEAPGIRGVARPAAITSYRPNELWIDVQAEEPVWLIVAESYYPGWRAWVRPFGESDASEQEVEIALVDGNFRGVMLEPGAWTVRMKFSPDPVKIGAFASFMAGMLVVFLIGVWLWRYAYREDPGESSTVKVIAKNSFAPIMLNLFNRGIQFAFAAIMLRILGPAASGDYYFAIAIWGWFDILTNFGLNTLLTREVARDPEHANRYLVNTSLMRFVLALLGVLALAALIGLYQLVLVPVFGVDALTRDVVLVLWLLYAGLFFSTQSYGLSALFYAFQKAEIPAAITTVSAMLSAILGVLALILGWGIVGLALVSIAVSGVTLILLYALFARLFFRPRWEIDPALRRAARSESFPLMLNHLLATLGFRIDVVLLRPLRGATVVGWYSTAYKWVDAMNIIPSFFTQALFPVMSRQAAEDRPGLLRSYILSIKLLSLISLPVAVIIILLARLLIGLLGGAEFLPHGAIALQLFVLSIPIGWINSVTNYVVIATDHQRALMWTFVVQLIFNVAANLIFIPLAAYGYEAAAIITSFSELLLLVLFYGVLRRALGRIPWIAALWRIVAAALIMAGAAAALAQVHVLLAAVGSLAVYLLAIALLRPFSDAEMAGLAPLLPSRLRARLRKIEAAPGEV